MKVTKALIQDLNNLLTRNHKVQNAYVMAANHINTKELSKWLVDYSDQRHLFSQQLAIEIRRLGGEPVSGDSLIGEISRVWIDLKGDITNNDPAVMLEACKQGEESALEDYDEILEKHRNMPQPTMDMLNRHKSKIILAISQIKAMLKAYVSIEQTS